MKVIDAKNVKELLTSLAIVPNMITEKWLNEHTLKAIPIEWIEKYIKQNYCTCDLVYPEEFLKELVTWWGEENETN